MVFHCHCGFKLETKCEWQFLSPFVEQLNRENGTTFHLERCLDASPELNGIPQPEVLLVDSKGDKAVIERKSIVWPKRYIEHHKKWHRKAESIARLRENYYEEILSTNDTPESIVEARQNALCGFKDAYIKMLPKVVLKFANWPNAVHILVVQFIGDDNWIFNVDIEQIIKQTETSEVINQVWVAFHNWTDEFHYNISWKCLKNEMAIRL